MKKASLISIRNATIASVIAGVILMLLPELRGYFFNFLVSFGSGVIWCWEALFDSYSLPGWALLLISLLALIGLINIFISIRQESEEPEFKSYVEDFIHGAIWRWDWAGERIANIWCFCPRCDATLVYDDSSHDSFYSTRASKTDFICENCNGNVVASISGGDKDYAKAAVKREVDRRIRTGKYK